jgi:peptidyl-tRNA hydrolase, PTH1 family
MRFYKLTPADLIVFHDELDLPAAKVRVKTGGGHGGHNGLKSIDAHCGREYRRVRLGIGHPGSKEMVHNHVLGDFAKIDQTWLEPLLDDIALHTELLFSGDGSQFMNKLAGPAVDNKPAKAEKPLAAARAAPAGKSHIHQARGGAKPAMPATGPMAEMLKRLWGKKDE